MVDLLKFRIKFIRNVLQEIWIVKWRGSVADFFCFRPIIQTQAALLSHWQNLSCIRLVNCWGRKPQAQLDSLPIECSLTVEPKVFSIVESKPAIFHCQCYRCQGQEPSDSIHLWSDKFVRQTLHRKSMAQFVVLFSKGVNVRTLLKVVAQRSWCFVRHMRYEIKSPASNSTIRQKC